MEELLANLNPPQREAVSTTEGPLLVIAGAGSGKTKVLTHRIAYLVAHGVEPESILAVTFTNKAAGEMKERVARLLPRGALSARLFGTGPWIGTFHALGVYLLRHDGASIGIPRSFTILDEDDVTSIIKRISKEHALDPKQYPTGRMRHIISLLKHAPFKTEDVEENTYPKEIQQLYYAYEKELVESRALDFDDLLLRTTQLFKEHPVVLEKWQNRWRYVLVDEYQDTNHIQYALTKLLAYKHKNIMVVGDADQAIYSWRGANVRNILSFEKDWPNARVITLEQNYRSTAPILEAANRVIQKNTERKEKNLWSERGDGPPLLITVAENERHEAQIIAGEITRLGRRHPLRDMAILYRTNAQSRALEEALVQRRIPYRLIGGVRFYERKEIKDILAFMRLAANPRHLVSMRRVINVPPRGIGKTLADRYFSKEPLRPREAERVALFSELLQKLEEACKTQKTSSFLETIIKKTGYESFVRNGTPEGEERWANIRELFTVTATRDMLVPPEGTEKFLEEASLLSDADLVDRTQDAIHVMTVHAAKGLEFEIVFVAGLEEGIFPHALSMQSAADMEEERRLCYVALTRAKTHLYLSTAQTRTLYGDTIWSEPSRFLKDIPEHLLSMQVSPKHADEENIVGYEA